MLVVTREQGESIDLYLEPPGLPRAYLGRVTFLGLRRGRAARIGFDGPTSVVVVRSELDLDNPPTKETVGT